MGRLHIASGIPPYPTVVPWNSIFLLKLGFSSPTILGPSAACVPALSWLNFTYLP